MTVPEALRQTLGKRELLEALGPDRATALRRLPMAVASMQATLDAARGQPSPQASASRAPSRNRPLYPAQIARAHYDAELAIDDAARAGGELAVDSNPADFGRLFAPGYHEALKKVAAGHASDDEIRAAIGWAIDGFAERGNTDVQPGTPDWRALARTLAGVQLEALKRSQERDGGEYGGKPSHPALVEQAAPVAKDASSARILSPDSQKPLSELLADFLKERGAKPSTNFEYDVAIRMFEESMGEAKPAYKITRADVQASPAWRCAA